MAQMPSYERKEILLYVAEQIRIHSEDIATILVAEVGKTITDARGEVGRYESKEFHFEILILHPILFCEFHFFTHSVEPLTHLLSLQRRQ